MMPNFYHVVSYQKTWQSFSHWISPNNTFKVIEKLLNLAMCVNTKFCFDVYWIFLHIVVKCELGQVKCKTLYDLC